MDEINKPKISKIKRFWRSLSPATQVPFSFIGIFIVIIIFFSVYTIVPAGHVKVIDFWGNVYDNELNPGIHLKNPLANVVKFDTRIQEYTMSYIKQEGKVSGDDSINTLTKEGLNVGLDITVWYHLDGDFASDIYKSIGRDYEVKIIRPQIRTAIREIVAKYEAKDIYSGKREIIAVEIEDNLKKAVTAKGIIIEKVLLRNVKLPLSLEDAIQSKLAAEQEAEKMEFVLLKEMQEKDRKRIEAEGIKQAQEIIAQSLTENYLHWYWLQKLNENPNVVYVATEAGLPLFREV